MSESTWARLTRRKVVQWGIAYAAGAWGFVQGLEYLSDTFHWPEQLRQIALLAILVGLPKVYLDRWSLIGCANAWENEVRVSSRSGAGVV